MVTRYINKMSIMVAIVAIFALVVLAGCSSADAESEEAASQPEPTVTVTKTVTVTAEPPEPADDATEAGSDDDAEDYLFSAPVLNIDGTSALQEKYMELDDYGDVVGCSEKYTELTTRANTSVSVGGQETVTTEWGPESVLISTDGDGKNIVAGYVGSIYDGPDSSVFENADGLDEFQLTYRQIDSGYDREDTDSGQFDPSAMDEYPAFVDNEPPVYLCLAK